jgi:poly-gamma-glutamate synthesis protein (capsule biosynthesis protein)
MDFVVYHIVSGTAKTAQMMARTAGNAVLSAENQIHRRVVWTRRWIFILLAALLLPSGVYVPYVRLAFLGDIMLGRGVAEAHAGGDWYTALHSLSAITRSADLSLANLESPFCCKPSGSSDARSLAAPPAAAEAVSSAGLNVLSTVNNHSFDAGEQGRKCTKAALSGKGMHVLDSPATPIDLRIRGIGIRLLAFDFTDEVTGSAVDELLHSVGNAPPGTIVIVSLHWGMEYQSGHDGGQRKIADLLAAAGADILWGHHPHVVQETEWLDDTLVMYSLGNALFDQHTPASVRHGALAWVEADRRGVRLYATVSFAIDARRGRTGFPDPLSVRLSFPPPSRSAAC